MLSAVLLATMAPVSFAAESPAFQNGPYLLAPKTNSMVVVWESTQAVGSTIAYGTDANNLCELSRSPRMLTHPISTVPR